MTINWDHPELAGVAVDITPPGTARGEWQRGRGGLISWQDERNFVMVSQWIEDDYEEASIAIFLHLDGFEEIYDAVWNIVGSKIYWGASYEFRVVFDGLHHGVHRWGTVMYRALTDIYAGRGPVLLNRVGLAVNCEWGDDTGSTFAKFVAKPRRSDS